jgi:hypothetical protein
MADNEQFEEIAQVIERTTSLDPTQSRGLVRRLLKEAGLNSQDVTPYQLTALGKTLLNGALVENGIADPDNVVYQWLAHCERQIERVKAGERVIVSNTVEEVFARMARRR